MLLKFVKSFNFHREIIPKTVHTKPVPVVPTSALLPLRILFESFLAFNFS